LTRRTLAAQLSAVTVAGNAARASESQKLQIGILLFPGLTQLDLTGPFEVLSRLSNSEVHLIWRSLRPVKSDRGLTILPTKLMSEAPKLDVLVIPGGPGVGALMEDAEVLQFVQQQASQVRYLTSVCTGALVLGAAGLLRGYQATTHWASLEFLADFGAIASKERIVVDRNRITGGGVTAGIDFALRLAAELRGESEAKRIQLQLEYNPAPPFLSGHPDVADPTILAAVRQANRATVAQRREIVQRAKKKL
jgi:cyclohexyl-isocyanide hydratase